MKISLCITVLNEENSIGNLIESLLVQSRKPDQIIFVDGGSTDKTTEIIRHYQNRDGRIKLFVEKCSRAEGRNFACEIAKGDVIAMTDAGCVADRDWLKNLVEPFKNKNVEVSAGFYKMTGGPLVSKAMSVFLGTQPKDFDVSFLPSTRSIAFRKELWERIGGFPEKLTGAAEDTVFNLKIVKNEAKIARVKNAIVEWGMPETLSEFYSKVRNYAKGDAKSNVWLFPGKGLASHNIKALFVLFRYILGISLFICILIFQTPLLVYWIIGLLIYLSWSYRKVYMVFRESRVAVWGPILQITADIAVIKGFVSGIIGR